jgi:hypothetical protein
MFSLVRWAIALLFCLIVIGFWRGWFTLSPAKPEPSDKAAVSVTQGRAGELKPNVSAEKPDKVNVTVSVDRTKIRSDVKKVKDKIKDEVRQLEGRPAPTPSK